MDKQEKLAFLDKHSFAFHVDLTLDEIEWTRILGPDGLGRSLLDRMVDLGAGFVEIDGLRPIRNARWEGFSFRVDDGPFNVRLEYDEPCTANLQNAIRQVLDGMNRALARQTVPFRYIFSRDTSTGAGYTYRLVLLPTPWLGQIEDDLHIVAGVRLEDYEVQRPFGRPPVGRGFLNRSAPDESGDSGVPRRFN